MSFPLIFSASDRRRAFTLIELLTVIAIIGVLAGITFGVVGAVQNRAAISQARSELATLSQALESYKKQYGDYPQLGASAVSNSAVISATASATSVEGLLFNALLGKVGPTKAAIQGKQFLDASKFSLQGTAIPTAGNTTAVDNGFVDPWGRLYVYYYKAAGVGATNWKQPSFVLLSAGPDGITGVSVSAAGVVTESDVAKAADNIFANR